MTNAVLGEAGDFRNLADQHLGRQTTYYLTSKQNRSRPKKADSGNDLRSDAGRIKNDALAQNAAETRQKRS